MHWTIIGGGPVVALPFLSSDIALAQQRPLALIPFCLLSSCSEVSDVWQWPQIRRRATWYTRNMHMFDMHAWILASQWQRRWGELDDFTLHARFPHVLHPTVGNYWMLRCSECAMPMSLRAECARCGCHRGRFGLIRKERSESEWVGSTCMTCSTLSF